MVCTHYLERAMVMAMVMAMAWGFLNRGYDGMREGIAQTVE